MRKFQNIRKPGFPFAFFKDVPDAAQVGEPEAGLLKLAHD